MKTKYLLLYIFAVLVVSCTKHFEEFNTDVKNPSTASGESLFTKAELSMTDQVNTSDVNINIFKLISQYWTETTYTDEANYNIVNRIIPDNIFQQYFVGDVTKRGGFLTDFKEAARLINLKPTTTDAEAGTKTNKLAIIELLNVYSWQNLVDIFGNIPYTQALDINNIAPVYDDAATIYLDLIKRVDAAEASLNPAFGSFDNADLIYAGDVLKWQKFGNSLKLKLGITLSKVNPVLAKTTVESAVTAGVFVSNDDNAILNYLGAVHTNPLYTDIVTSGRDDFVPANTIVDLMNGLNDQRRTTYFTTIEGVYSGGQYGESSPFTKYSHISPQILAPTFPGILLTYDEVAFYEAEAAERGFFVGGTSVSFYNEGITASIEFWGLTAADAAAYLAQPGVAYATAPGPWQKKIGTQAYIAFYTRGLEAWTEWRRLNYPIFNLPPTITDYNQIPRRFTYPIGEQTLNKANYTSASSAIGGDLTSTRIFWDVPTP